MSMAESVATVVTAAMAGQRPLCPSHTAAATSPAITKVLKIRSRTVTRGDDEIPLGDENAIPVVEPGARHPGGLGGIGAELLGSWVMVVRSWS
ncbi:hypothetical protein IU427_00875 [Nocardia beijingensis]|uniref:hypothetical protein n=1 Tax=Nocardia beijingensis TaxID=95162 RepID=UPI0018955795|nr:hypothetical protein [Nocardia beijingensis]MBF6463731.1 hypothetical protein [Nocardia beijingensis]